MRRTGYYLKPKNNFHTDEKGIGLVEVLAAVSIAVIVITSLVALSLYTLRSSINSRMLLEGTKLANTQMELVRAFRDITCEWNDFVDVMTQTDCLTTTVDGACSIDIDELTVANACDPTHADVYNIVNLSADQYAVNTTGATQNVDVYFTVEEISGIIRVYVTADWESGSVTSTMLQSDFSNWRSK